MLVAEVRQRLIDRAAVTRCEGTVELMALVQAGALPPVGESAFVVPMGYRGGAGLSTGAGYVQATEEAIAVVLAIRVQGGAVPTDAALEARIDTVIRAVAGWQPPGAPDVFRLIRGAVLSLEKGVLLYQIEFATQSQLRIVT